MTDKKQELLPPTRAHVPVYSPPAAPSLPSLPAGNSVWPFPVGRYERNSREVAGSAAYMRARADQAAACAELIAQREALGLAIARLHSLPERCQFEYERARLERLNTLELLRLQHELEVTNKKIEVANASMNLARALPIQEVPAPPAPPPTPAPSGLSLEEVEQMLMQMPDVKPETIRPLILALGGVLAEKSRR